MMPIAMTRPHRPPETKRLPLALADVDSEGTFVGYASLFGVADLARDVVEPGAFKASLERRGVRGVRMLWHHDPAQPIGAWLQLTEDARGLAVRGRLLPDVARGREALALMRSGALDGLSIGFRTVRAQTEKKSGTRRLIEIDLWEISLVTFPMLPDARVAAVKGGGAPRDNCVAAVKGGAPRDNCVAAVKGGAGLATAGPFVLSMTHRLRRAAAALRKGHMHADRF